MPSNIGKLSSKLTRGVYIIVIFLKSKSKILFKRGHYLEHVGSIAINVLILNVLPSELPVALILLFLLEIITKGITKVSLIMEVMFPG